MTLRSRLATVSGKKETWYDLGKRTDKIIQNMIEEIDRYVLPAFEVLNSREAILAHRREYPLLDDFCATILLDECMIYGHLGEVEKAKKLFEAEYQATVEDYNDQLQNGHKLYLKKGERVVFMGQDITAEKDGFVTLYGANRGYIDHLDELEITLGLR